MWLLALERSSAAAGAALFHGGRLVEAVREGQEPARSPQWLAAVGGLLSRAGLDAAGPDAVCVGLGPGSFSGIRAALAGALGMGLPRGTPVYGVGSAAALAHDVLTLPGAPAMVAVVGDARRGCLWAAVFSLAPGGGVVVVNGRDAAAARHEAGDFHLGSAAALAAALPPGVPLVSPDYGRLRPLLEETFGAGRVAADASCADAVAVGRLFLAAPAAAARAPLPIYLHPAVGAAP